MDLLRISLLFGVICGFAYATNLGEKVQVHPTVQDVDEEKAANYKRMIAPGYYSQECNVHKPCPDGNKYCHMFLCVDCLKENVACTQNGQCCPGTECTYGRCKKGSSKGKQGTFCDRQKDCVGANLCCVREPAINPVISICKPALDEHQTCGPYNQFRTVYIGGTVQPVCGPCKQGLVCKQVGIFGVHEICLPSGAKGKK